MNKKEEKKKNRNFILCYTDSLEKKKKKEKEKEKEN